MKEIKFSINKVRGIYDLCITPCPYSEDKRVGSLGCMECEHFINSDFEHRIVYCNYDVNDKEGK